MKRSKKIMSVFLCLTMLLTIAPLSTFSYAANSVDDAMSVMPGDVNSDGVVDGKDSTRLLQYLAEWDVEINSAAADCNGDGIVDGKDSTRLLQYLAEWVVTLESSDPDSIDTDGDGLPDDEEEHCHTDKTLKDTDGDFFSDYEEVIMGTDPLTPNSLDTEMDSDSDGLVDIEEIRI